VLPTLRAGRVSLRPLTRDDAATLAVDMLEHPSVRRWWGTPGTRGERREGLLNEGRAFAIEVDGELAGWLGFEEELEPDYKHASLDISLVPGRQGQGHGPAALRLAARWLVDERGHHRITIDPSRLPCRRLPRRSCAATSARRRASGRTAC
jgi:aminoglycoside 6'-N-acetyltransferase